MASWASEVTSLPLVLDANILLRAVFGSRAYGFIRAPTKQIAFCTPDVCFEEARRYVLPVAERRGFNLQRSLSILHGLEELVDAVDSAEYAKLKVEAEKRISRRDPNDWPILATALLLNAPIWTEDQDFFGCGVATWITATVHLYLRP